MAGCGLQPSAPNAGSALLSFAHACPGPTQLCAFFHMASATCSSIVTHAIEVAA